MYIANLTNAYNDIPEDIEIEQDEEERSKRAIDDRLHNRSNNNFLEDI